VKALEFRKAIPEDAENILSLWRAAETVHGVTDTVEDVRSMASHEHAAFILAFCNGRI